MAETAAGEGGAIDGKARRHSFDKGRAKRVIHMVSAWATANGVVLGQRKVDAKSNETTAIPELLDLLALKGGMVTIDAMGCQRTIAQKIVEQGADYVLALKGHQPTREQAVARFFVTGPQAEAPRASSEYQEQTEQGHGRVETRGAWISAELDAELRATAWPGLRSIGMVEATRTMAGETRVEQRFYLSSLPPAAPQFARAVRTHWGIENTLHWTLAVTFGKLRGACGLGMGPRTLPGCATSRSSSYAKSPAPSACPASASPARSILTTCLRCCWDSRLNALALAERWR